MPDYFHITSDYTPFGSIMIGRSFESGVDSGYRYGFNGKEGDDEISGDENEVDFGARILDSRLARWLNVDPFWKVYTSYSPYNFGACNPLNNIDIAGQSIVPADEKSKTDHLLFHFMLPYSNWEHVTICYSESFESLSQGYDEAVWTLGGVTLEHRTDNLSAAAYFNVNFHINSPTKSH
jgi:RHS repeat-associated protein